MTTSRTVTLAGWVRNAMDKRLEDLHSVMPARIESYDAQKLTVTVKPLIKLVTTVAGKRRVESRPVLTDIPVAFPGGLGVHIDWPLHRGDLVLLLVSEASLDVFKRDGNEVDPLDERRHDLSDAIAIPLWLRPRQNAAARIEFTETEIRAGASLPTESTVKGETRAQAEAAFLVALGTYLAALGTATGLSQPAATFATALADFQTALLTTLTTQLKVA